MDRKGPKRRRIEIPLPSKPRPYRPGDGPSLAPVRLTLDNDSTAFIVEKRVIPSQAPNGELKLDLCYDLGWSDLPAARVAILATKVLDYVSPRTLEDWEYKCLVEQDAERERQEAEEKRQADELAQARARAERATATPNVRIPLSATATQKKRGRPSKAEMVAKKIAKQAGFAPDELASVPISTPSIMAPSLSTPQKTAPLDAEEPEENPNEAIAKQLYGSGSPMESGSGSESQDPDDIGDLDIAAALAPSRSVPGPSSRGYGTQFSVSAPSSIPFDDLDSPVPISLRAQPLAPKLTTPVPVPLLPEVTQRTATTAVPVPAYALSKQKPRETPVPPPTNVLRDTLKPKPEKTFTPVPVPSLPKFARVTHREESGPGSVGSTPVALSSQGRRPEKHHTPDGGKNQSIAPPTKKLKSSRKKKPAKNDDNAWEVKRLEGDKLVDFDGEYKQYYRVRWEGDWPPGENPTWEPEANISKSLIDEYWQKKTKKTGQGSPERPKPVLKRKWSSVAEAFEGDTDDATLRNAAAEDDSNGAEERLDVTGRKSRTSSPARKARVEPSLLTDLWASFRGSRAFGS
ncbi:hypothetical protein GGR57DRAFT_451497 [Xylariaceae sp. FL1272]|nr:hypothetical protein GGR57DRAFT_451497 [Xylariaceae sp. FL1272]